MTLARGRILGRATLTSEPLAVRFAGQPACLPFGRVLKRVERAALERAREILASAETQAAAIAEASARALTERVLIAEAEARANALAELAAHAIRLARREATSDERQLDRTVHLARLLAERLIGAELALDETRIVTLAGEALREVRGARRVVLEAHPEDARVLRTRLCDGSSCDETYDVIADESLDRGQLRLRTEAGVLDARLDGRLEILAERLLEGLRS